jgi:hypothetical protein
VDDVALPQVLHLRSSVEAAELDSVAVACGNSRRGRSRGLSIPGRPASREGERSAGEDDGCEDKDS